jgi:serine/threonine-protein kinase
MAKLLKPVPGTLTSKHKMPCGLAEYAAPEQAVTTELDGRADVYAMGVVLYELLTGQVPFRGGNDAAVLAKHQREPVVPPQKLRVDRFIPREIERICMKALSKQATDRYRSPREFRSALNDTLELLGVRADLPIEAPQAASADADPLSKDRLTMPGEQLRSRHKIGLGVGLLLLVCSIIWLSAPNETRETRATPEVGASGTARAPAAENAALAEGRRRLAEDDVKGAAEELARARQQLGETPELARWLGEALLRSGQRERGEALLRRYLELVPHADDRETVDALLSSETSSR